VIRRAPVHEIEDYKSGAVYEEDSSELKAAYRVQMLLYAALERAESGSWPDRATVIPLQGDPVTITISPADAEGAEQQALNSLDEYNSLIRDEKNPAKLGRPSPDHCRFCEYSVFCPAFWSQLDTAWRTGNVVAAEGALAGREFAQRGSVALHIDVRRGDIDPGRWTFVHIDPGRFPQATRAEQGATVAFTAAIANDDARVLRPTDRTRFAVAETGRETERESGH
jgi:hypothetical protein